MEIFQLVIGIIIIVSVKYLIIKFFYNRLRVSKLSQEELKFDKIRPIYNKLKKDKVINKNTISKYAKNLEKRILVFEALKKHNKIELFPSELLTREKASESYLANWLNMNDEYDNFPDEINFLEMKEYESTIFFLIFKFKSYEPHLFANRGWMYGYVGHKINDLDVYANPEVIFSEFNDNILTLNDLKEHLTFK